MKFGRFSLAVALVCFFLSGLAGLVYQVVWTRYLALFLGHTSYSVVAVLAAFMGGLALGNAWIGRISDRAKRPLFLYALLELGIALYAILFPSCYGFVHDVFIGMARKFQPGSVGLLGLKFFFSLLTILLPAVLMGATFPVMTKFVTRSLGELRKKVAELYCLNSVGAVAGCFVADFWWIPSIGLEMTVYFAAVANLAAAFLAFAWSRKVREGWESAAEEAPVAVEGARVPAISPAQMRMAILAIGASGFVAMLYEVAWTRLLALVLGSSTHAYSLMLISFISGIAIGAWLVQRWTRIQDNLAAFGWAEIALGGIVFLSMFTYAWLPYGFSKIAGVLIREEQNYRLYELLQMGVCFAVMLAPTICLGVTLPLASRAATEQLSRAGASVGKVFAVNTIGTVLGAACTGLVLMPWLGLAETFALGVALNVLIGVSLLRPWKLESPANWAKAAAAAAFAVVLAGVLFNDLWRHVFTLGLYRLTPPATASDYMKLARGLTLKYYQDGAGATVSSHYLQAQGESRTSMRVNGKTEASTGNDMPTQLMVGHLPMILRPKSERALVVGFGSGITCGAVGRHASLKQLDVVEISPEVIEASLYFTNYNYRILDDPRCRVIIEDAKSFLKISDAQYDVIISQPSNPWMAGVAGVFSQEYYQDCQKRLAADGAMVQWVQLYETSDTALNTVFATFASVFRHVGLWQGARQDLILVGSSQPLSAPLAAVLGELGETNVQSSLNRAGLANPTAFLSLELVPASDGPFLAPPNTAVQSDFYPSLEYLSQRTFFTRERAKDWRAFDQNLSARPATRFGQYHRGRRLETADYEAMGRIFAQQPVMSTNLFRSMLRGWRASQPDATLPLELSALLDDPPEAEELQALRLRENSEEILRHAQQDPELLRLYTGFQMKAYRQQRSAFFLPPSEEIEKSVKRLMETDPANARLWRLYLAELAWDRGDDASAFSYDTEALKHPNGIAPPSAFAADPAAASIAIARVIEGYWAAGKIAEAWEVCGFAIRASYYDPASGRGNPRLRVALEKVKRAVEKPQ